MKHPKKILTPEVRGNKRFFYTQSGVRFWFRPLFGKMIAAPPGWSTFREKIFIWANSVIIHSLKNMFKVPGGIRWQFFPVQMRSVTQYLIEKLSNMQVKMTQEGLLMRALLTSIRMSWKVPIYYISGVLLIPNHAVLYIYFYHHFPYY